MAEGEEPVAWTGRRAVVAFPEHVDGSNAVQIRDQLLTVFDTGAAVVIADMSATASCDHAGIDAVSLAYQQAAIRRSELRLVATTPTVRRLLAAQGLDRLVPVYPSVETAMAAGEQDRPDPPADSALLPVAPRGPARPRVRPGPGPLNEAMLWQLIDALADGIVLADEDGRIVLVNRQAAAMFAYQPGELAGRPVESLVPVGLRDTHRLDRAAYALKPVARPMADRARLAGLRRDGTTTPVMITLSPVPTASGHFVLAVVRDATHERWQDDFTGLVRSVLQSRWSTPRNCWTGSSAACFMSGSAWIRPQASPRSWPGSRSPRRSSGWMTSSTRSVIMSSGSGARAAGRPLASGPDTGR